MSQKKFREAFDEHRKNYRKGEKLELLDDLEAQFEEEDLIDLLTETAGETRWIMVTADRRFNDNLFDYGYWDMLLSLISRFNGRPRILKPLHQVRVVRWRGSRSSLRKVLRVARHNAALNYGSLLLLPYVDPVVADNIDASGYPRFST